MTVARVLIAFVLAGSGGSVVPRIDRSSAVLPQIANRTVEHLHPEYTQATTGHFDTFPTGFAPCANDAGTVKEAAYYCLRDWTPAMQTYPGKVVFHFSPSLGLEKQEEIKQMTFFTLERTQGFLDFSGFAPKFHLFFNIDGQKECEKMVKSWKGTKDLSWIWKRGVCSSAAAGGNATGSTVHRATAAIISVSAVGYFGADWWTYHGMPHEIMAAFFPQTTEEKLGSKILSLEVGQLWVQYLASRAAWQAAGIQVLEEDLDFYHNNLLPGGGIATWQPTVSDPRFCPQGRSIRARRCGTFDWEGLMSEFPWNYTVMDLASEFVTATFGPEWVQRTLWPAMVQEYSRTNEKDPVFGARGHFRAEMNRVAKRLWGGQWSDLEDAIDSYVVSALKAGGMSGLD